MHSTVPFEMFRNYLSVALRNLLKHKVHSTINVLGLAIGLASFVLIFLYVKDELSYDRYHSKADRIYRVTAEIVGAENSSSMPFPAGHTLLADFPNFVEETTRFFNFQVPTVAISHAGENGDVLRFNESRFFMTDSTVFRVFDWKMLKGDVNTALTVPNTMVITESTARKYFGDDEALGKTLRLEQNGNLDFEVVGVLEDVPKNSHFEFDILASLATTDQFSPNGQPFQNNNWFWNPVWTYVVLQENADVATFESFFPEFVDKYWPQAIKADAIVSLQKLTDIHLNSNLDFEIAPNSDVAYVYIFSVIAFFILFIACINFMNLTTARSGQRSREVGMRKVLGAMRPQLVRQFLSESVLLAVLATIVAVPLVYLALPGLNSFADKALAFNPLGDPALVLGLVGVSLLVGSVSGLYPALFLSSFQPAHVLKGSLRIGQASLSTFFRKGLVVVQFGISIMLIVGTVVAYNQLGYMKEKDLGFEEEQVVLVSIAGSGLTQQYRAFKDQALQHAGITDMTIVHDIPGSKYQTNSYTVEAQADPLQFPVLWVHDDVVETLKMDLVAGRGYSEEFPADSSSSIMINEAMVEALGFGTAEETLGRRITANGLTREIVGVVEDFHYASLHSEIAPFVLERFANPGQLNFFGRYLAVRFSPGDVSGTLAFLEEKWNAFIPGRPFEYAFLDSELDQLYTGETTLGKVATTFSILAIFVACLGLFGMAMFTAERRTKEIGIRKAMGASTTGIVGLLSQESVKLVVVAFVIACPLAWVAINRWLDTFTYHTEVGFWPFAIAGMIVLSIAWLTVSAQSIRAAMANPVDSLQTD